MSDLNQPGDIFFHIVIIFNYILILFALITIFFIGPATGYEFSIYAAYPWFFWIFLIGSFFSSLLILLWSAIYPNKNKYWIFSFFAVILIDTILLTLPLIRGYFGEGSGDVLTHIGHMKDILNTGHIGVLNMYPINHILGTVINLTSSLPLHQITMIIPCIFSIFFIVSIYVLAKQLFKNSSVVLIALALATIPLFGNINVLFFPNGQAFLLLPFYLFIIFKYISGEFRSKLQYLLIITSILIVFFHPLIFVFVILLLLVILLTQKIYANLYKEIVKIPNIYLLITLMGVVFFLWTSYIYALIRVVKPFSNAIFDVISENSEFIQLTSRAQATNLGIIDSIHYIFNVYGQNFILIIISLLCIFSIFTLIIKRREKVGFPLLFSSLAFLFFMMFSLLVLVKDVGDQFHWWRVYRQATIFSIFIIPAYFIYYFTPAPNNKYKMSIKTKKFLLLSCIIFFILFISIFNLYLSPIVRFQGQQVTASEYYGMRTFFLYRNIDTPIHEMGISQNRFYGALFGESVTKTNIVFLPMDFQDHFGYDKYNSIKSVYNETSYFLLNDVGRYTYPVLYPEFVDRWHFTPNDFTRLKSDNVVHFLYSNKNLDVYLINP